MQIFKNPTFIITVILCLLFLFTAFWLPVDMREKIAVSAIFTLDLFGDYYLYLGFSVVVCLLVLAISPIGKIKLGDQSVEYNWYSWVAMLYSTGMGAGLMLRAVQEPVYYYIHPPREGVLDRVDYALKYTFFHWGFTPWAFYGMFGLIIAFLMYRHKRTSLSSSILSGWFQKKIFAVPLDIITIISTLFGVVGAVGLGSRQLLSGYRQLFDLAEINSSNVIYIILFLGVLATLSAFSGLSKGIRNISRVNVAMAILILVFTWYSGDRFQTLENFVRAIGTYIADFIPMSLNMGDHHVDKAFLMDWTYFYWAFWLAWAPFTGVFIARISRGRTIREFILGVLIIPSLGTFLWFSVFGTQAFEMIGEVGTYQGKYDSLYSSTFLFFEQLPLGNFLQFLALSLIFTFLITSIDSAIFVLGMFSDYGNKEPKKVYLLLWGALLALFTIATVYIGKEQLLESISQLLILIAIPFSFVYLLMIFTFLYLLMAQQDPRTKK